jgi:hypothetical protein
VCHRYGFEPEKGLGSITRREVEAARSAGKDVLVWIAADDHPWTEKKEQDLLTDPTLRADPSRLAEAMAGVWALGEFKAWLRKTFACDTFTTPDEPFCTPPGLIGTSTAAGRDPHRPRGSSRHHTSTAVRRWFRS